MHLYEDQFEERHDFPRVEAPAKTLVIASTPRSGSHMLGHLLHEAGCFGFPLEYANPANLAEWRRRLGIDAFPSALAELMRRRTSPNGVFGIKVHYSHLTESGGLGGLVGSLPEPRFVLLTRRDVLRQAVSFSIAEQTGVWISGQAPSGGSARYDAEAIDRCLRSIVLDNASWKYALAASGRDAMELEFERVAEDPRGTVEAVAAFMDVTLDPGRLRRGIDRALHRGPVDFA